MQPVSVKTKGNRKINETKKIKPTQLVLNKIKSSPF